MAPAVRETPRSPAHRKRGSVSKTSLARLGRKRKCRTNRGKFMRLETMYRHGSLTGEQRAAFEWVILDLWRLERAVST